MTSSKSSTYKRGFFPYAAAAFLIGLTGGLSTVLGPAFMLDQNLPYSNTTWTALAQAVSTAACAPILGRSSDLFGRRKTLLAGIFVFTLGNLFSALSDSLIDLMIARFIVGVGTAAIAPTILSYIVTEFPPAEVAKGFSLYMLLSSAAVIFGPSIGSLLLEASGWRALMWVSSFLCVFFGLLCFFTLPKENVVRKSLESFDFGGSIFVILFFSLLLCIPSFGQSFGWSSAPFLGVLFFAVVSLFFLILTEKRAKNPVLSGSFIRRKAFVLSVLTLFLTQGLMQANMTNTIVFVNHTQPANSALSGYAISIMYLGMSLGSVFLGPLADRFEPKYVLVISLLLTGAGCGLMLLFSQTTAFYLLAASLGILGFGLGANAAIFMKIVLSGLSPETAGAGTGTYGLFRDLAAPFGVAVFVPMFTDQILQLSESMEKTLSEAAVVSIHQLAWIELGCIAAGIFLVSLLPKIRHL